jgi:hypothetical protein
VLSEEWPAQRLQEFVAALGRGKRIRDEDLEVVRADASPMESRIAQTAAPVPEKKPAPRLFERSERRFVLHLDRARACNDTGLRSELEAAIRELASEFAGG